MPKKSIIKTTLTGWVLTSLLICLTFTVFSIYQTIDEFNEKNSILDKELNRFEKIREQSQTDPETVMIKIRKNQEKLKTDLLSEILFVLFVAITISILVVKYTIAFSKALKSDLDLVAETFDKLKTSSDITPKDLKKLQFQEFIALGKSARVMSEQTQKLVSSVKELALEAEASSQLKNSYLANINRELRSPLNGIMGMAHILSHSTLDEEQKKYVEAIIESGKTLVQAVDDIRDIHTFEEQGKLDIKQQPFDLSDIVSEITETLDKKYKDQPVTLYTSLKEDVPISLLGDPVRVRQILSILLQNAIDSTEKGSVKLEIWLREKEDDIASIQFEITDDGEGVAESKLKNIFTFDHLVMDDSTKTPNLSLAVCQRIVRSMGGDICAQSEEGKGSTFYFTLHFLINKGTAESKKDFDPSATQIIRASEKKVTCLLVEDDPINRQVAFHFLNKIGLVVDTAEDGLEALNKFSLNSYDIVFMDCVLPEIDGYETTRRIREKNQIVPIIAMTSNALQSDKEQCAKAGMNDHIAKPFTLDILKETLKKHLKKNSEQ